MAIAWLCFASLVAGQSAVRDTVKAADPAAGAGQRLVAADYRIGASDILRIVIADMPEWSGIYPVSETGTLALPGMRVRAAGLTAAELAHTIALALQQAQQLRDPVVTVFVEEYRSQTVTVLGAVAHPSVYSLRKSTSLLEVLSMAGGLIPQSGNELTLQRRNWAAGSTETSGKDSISTIDLKRLMQGQDPALNLEVEGNDIVTVSTAPLVYVVGAVMRPGGFVLQDPGAGLTILQALAMAEGLRPTAAPNRALIIRTSPSQDALTAGAAGTLPSTARGMEGRQRQEIQINMARMLQGTESDVLLQANDVLFVPESGMKKSMQRMGEFAMQVVNGVAVYGIGYRVGGVH